MCKEPGTDRRPVSPETCLSLAHARCACAPDTQRAQVRGRLQAPQPQTRSEGSRTGCAGGVRVHAYVQMQLWAQGCRVRSRDTDESRCPETSTGRAGSAGRPTGTVRVPLRDLWPVEPREANNPSPPQKQPAKHRKQALGGTQHHDGHGPQATHPGHVRKQEPFPNP